jgi:HSP20 family molecular chaperone IbpA
MSIQDLIISGLSQYQSNNDLHGTVQEILSSSSTGVFTPIDVIDTKNNLYIYVDIPGVTSSSINIDFYNNNISICGEKIKKYNEVPFKKEIIYGKFNRKITLPICVTNQKNVAVSYTNGVLLITIDKQKESQNKFRINIKEDDLN